MSANSAPSIMLRDRFQALEAVVPHSFKEGSQLPESFGTSPVEPTGSVTSLRDKPRFLQHAKVLRDSRAGHREVRGDIARGQFFRPYYSQDLTSIRFGNSPQCRFHVHIVLATYVSVI